MVCRRVVSCRVRRSFVVIRSKERERKSAKNDIGEPAGGPKSKQNRAPRRRPVFGRPVLLAGLLVRPRHDLRIRPRGLFERKRTR